jgi:hypothetical protein
VFAYFTGKGALFPHMEEITMETHDAMNEEIDLVGRMTRLFTAPAETFEAVRIRRSWHDWVIPTLLTAVVATVCAQITMPLLVEQQQEAVEKQMRANEATMTKAQIEQQREIMEMTEGVTGPITLIMTPVSVFIMVFVISGLVLLVGRFIMGGELTYGQVLACEGYISLILVLQAAVLTPIRVAKESVLIMLGPALFFDNDALTGVVGRMLAMVDIFVLWQVVLGAVALTVLTRGSFGKALGSMLGLWVVYLVIFGAIANMGAGG